MRNIRVADRSEWVRDDQPGRVPPRRGRSQSIVDLIATIPTIALVPALLLVLGPAVAAGPTMTVRPGDALAGQKVLVEGTGFTRGERGVLTFDGSLDGMPSYRANGRGEFRVWLAVPSSAAPGDHEITARLGSDGAGGDRSLVVLVVDAANAVEVPSQPPSTVLPDPTSETPTVPPPAAQTVPPTAAPTVPPPAAQTVPPPAAQTVAPTAAPTQATPDQSLSGVDLGVRAYYYLWWSTTHWHDKLGSTYPYAASPLPLPATTDLGGCDATSLFPGNQLIDVADPLFTQDDSTAIGRDVRLAKSAGLSGFLLNWGGTGTTTQTVSESRYTQRFAAVLAAARDIGGFTNWLSYKTSTLPTVSAITNDATFIFRAYGTDGAWGQIAGRPVFVLTGSRKYPTADLSVISTALRPMFFLIGDESYSTLTADRMALFDGVSYYWSSQNPYTNPGSFSQLQSIADRVHAAGKPWLAPFAPGYNSQLLRGGSCVPRNDGETMRRLWSGNNVSNPNGWTLISWNEIAENTHVQPLTKWGNRYLDVLADLIAG